MAREHIVVLAHASDIGARAVARVLARGSVSTRMPLVLNPEHFSMVRWSHGLRPTGDGQTTLTLPDGRSIADTDIACLLNRIDYLPVRQFDRSSDRDRDYAATELQALVAGWLASLGERVVNRPTARATDGGPSSGRQWLAVAAAHGLPVVPSALATSARLLPAWVRAGDAPVRPLGPWVPRGNGAHTGRVPVQVGWSASEPTSMSFDPSNEVVVAGDRAVGPVADRFGEPCVAIAAKAGCRLAGFRFGSLGGQPVLRDVVTRPRLDQTWAAAAAAELLSSIAQRWERAR